MTPNNLTKQREGERDQERGLEKGPVRCEPPHELLRRLLLLGIFVAFSLLSRFGNCVGDLFNFGHKKPIHVVRVWIVALAEVHGGMVALLPVLGEPVHAKVQASRHLKQNSC